VGDAIGTTLEFRPPGSFTPLNEIIGDGPFRLQPGEWTDDTSMARCLAESLVAKRFDPANQMKQYLRRYRTGHMGSNSRCFDIGNTTREALLRFEKTGNPFAGPTAPESRRKRLNYASRGRTALLFENPEGVRMSGESSQTTHGASVTVDACRYEPVPVDNCGFDSSRDYFR
jgi:hypothetical protein